MQRLVDLCEFKANQGYTVNLRSIKEQVQAMKIKTCSWEDRETIRLQGHLVELEDPKFWEQHDPALEKAVTIQPSANSERSQPRKRSWITVAYGKSADQCAESILTLSQIPVGSCRCAVVAGCAVLEMWRGGAHQSALPG
ncbi:hypothetical protein LOC499530, partial [Rattus norvegicus]|uniref:LRRGT00189 n=2 Tax=Rattus norvegicus TaxID=10116 RepID=F7F6V5_RAT|eukprot:NP_001041406.1 uncharacterized protein LOC499530 [Rattus norvegicus]